MVAPLGGPRLPATVRVGFALLLALVASPALVAVGRRRRARGARRSCTSRCCSRASSSIGLCLGLVASAAFRAAEVAGRLGDTLRGANVAEILVPTAEERASPLGVLYLLLATIVFLQIGGVPRLVEALLSSYRTLPVGGGLGEPAARRAALVVVVASAKLIASGRGAGRARRRRALADGPGAGPDRARRAVGAGVLPRACRSKGCWRSAWSCSAARGREWRDAAGRWSGFAECLLVQSC